MKSIGVEPTRSPVNIVSFNYDRLMEEALRSRGVKIAALGDYVSDNRFKLFKVHGSIDWIRSVGIKAADIADPLNQWGAMAAVTERASSLMLGEQFFVTPEYPSGIFEGDLVAPAIAIPLEDKTDFECPKAHLSQLSQLLPLTKRLLVVGWRATERPFLQLLSSSGIIELSVFVVCGTQAEGQFAVERLQQAGLDGKYEVFDGGFSDMITQRALAAFLSSSSGPA